jgi:integrase
MINKHRESPTRRVNPSGSVVWVARYTDPQGRRVVAKPAWNGDRGTFDRKRDAQRAIDEAYETDTGRIGETVGEYFATWTRRHPRSPRTNATNDHRISRALDIAIEGRPLRDWPYRDLRRRHASAIVDALLREQKRSRNGAVNILRSLSAMTEDAITDEIADVNFVKGVRVRATDPRIAKPPKAKRVFTWQQMHAFASAAGAIRSSKRGSVRDYSAMVRTFADTSMRLGEVLPLERDDFRSRDCDVPDCRDAGAHFHVRRTAHEGQVQAGTKTDHGEPVPGRVVPCPPTLAVCLSTRPPRIDTQLLFPTPTGKLFRERNFHRDVWYPTVEVSGLDCEPHEFRHSYLTLLRASGVDDADLAAISGHTVETMLAHYTHSLGRSFEQVRKLIGLSSPRPHSRCRSHPGRIPPKKCL